MSKKESAVLEPAIEIDKILNEVPEKLPLEDWPLESLRDYRLYNEEARRLNRGLKVNRYPVKPCPVELHPTQRVKFSRRDQPSNPLPVYYSGSLIHFEKTLVPGKIYDLPHCIVNYLSELGDPVWGWVDLPDGGRETQVVRKNPRFVLQTVYDGM